MPVQVLDRRKRREPAADAPLLEARCRRLLALLGLSHNRLSVALVGDARMARLNRQYRGKTGPTNVLSFPAVFPSDAPPEMLAALRADAAACSVFSDLGDVLISVDTAVREAEAQDKPLAVRLTELMIHGVLHLAGYDHERSETEALVMWDKEQALFARLEAEENGTAVPAMPAAPPALFVNLNPVAVLRQAGDGAEPDPVAAALLCELAGARGIVAHLREDRGHIQERDLRLLRQTVRIPLNLEMAAADALLAFALDLRPDRVTLVPEHRQDSAAEGGLDVADRRKKLAPVVAALQGAGIVVSCLVDADEAQIRAAAELGASHVQLHASRYSAAADVANRERELVRLGLATELARELDLEVGAGRGLNHRNIGAVATIPGIVDLSVGHALVARAVLVGLDRAVREMSALTREGASSRLAPFSSRPE